MITGLVKSKSVPRGKTHELHGSDRTLETCQDMSENNFLPEDDIPEGEAFGVCLIEESKECANMQDFSKRIPLYEDDREENEHSFSDLYAHLASNRHPKEDVFSKSVPCFENDAFGCYCNSASPTTTTATRCPKASSMKQGPGTRRAASCVGAEFEVYLPGDDVTVKRRSAISFSEHVDVTVIVSQKEMVDNMGELWLCSEDYHSIMDRTYALADLASQRKRSRKYCTRGLEHLLDDFDESLLEDAIDAVLDKQDTQWELGEHCEAAIAKVYSIASFASKVEATMRAEEDAKSVRGYMKETRKLWKRAIII